MVCFEIIVVFGPLIFRLLPNPVNPMSNNNKDRNPDIIYPVSVKNKIDNSIDREALAVATSTGKDWLKAESQSRESTAESHPVHCRRILPI